MRGANGTSGPGSYFDRNLGGYKGVAGKGVDLASSWAFALAATFASSLENTRVPHACEFAHVGWIVKVALPLVRFIFRIFVGSLAA